MEGGGAGILAVSLAVAKVRSAKYAIPFIISNSEPQAKQQRLMIPAGSVAYTSQQPQILRKLSGETY